MYNRFILFILLSFLLSACAPPPPPKGYNLSKTEDSLAEASYSVSRSLVDISEITQAIHPVHITAPPPSPVSYGMGGISSVDWSGPVEPLLKQIAIAADYRLNVLGTRPAIPVLVTIYRKNEMLGDILRDVGYQCGERASVVVFPRSRVIELSYAKN